MPAASSFDLRTGTGTEPIAERDLARLRAAGARRVALLLHHGDAIEMRLLHPEHPVVIGRKPAQGWGVAERKLSREHARFSLSLGRILVEDLGSTNGTWLAGARISRAEIDAGDEVRLGDVLVRVQLLGPDGEELGVDGEARFLGLLTAEAERARQVRRRFALLTVRAAAAVHRGKAAPRAVAVSEEDHAVRWAAEVRSKLRPVDRMSLYSHDTLQILLPDADTEAALGVARAVVARDPGQTPRLHVGVAVYPVAASTVEALIEASRSAAGRGSAERPIEIAGAAAWEESEAPGDDHAPIAGAKMRDLLETVGRVAASRVPVVLHGETGTGKEVLARLIHDGGPRRSKRMVRVNCGAIPASLVESTLFGHEKGAFTGAVAQQKGVFEEADGGTVFLDELGELPLGAQTALLRVLETGSFSRVGSTREIAVDVRLVTATHRDLEAMIALGTFRADLYYRLSTVTLEIPPLRERGDEIEPLVRRFLRQASEAGGHPAPRIEDEAMALLVSYRWPGNIRELRNAIERAVVVAREGAIGAADLPARVQAACAAEPPAIAARTSPGPGDTGPVSFDDPPSGDAEGAPELRTKLQQYEAAALQAALESAGWKRAEAAQRLGMPLRTLARKIKVLGIKKPGE
jgi:DNA-binding NtrC family response regulator